MSEQRWTPGPWGIDERAATCVRGGALGHSVANCGGWSDNQRDVSAEQEANAHLIAAAPELYEALQEACIWDSHDEEGVEAVWLSKAQAALSKARGEAT